MSYQRLLLKLLTHWQCRGVAYKTQKYTKFLRFCMRDHFIRILQYFAKLRKITNFRMLFLAV